MTRNVIFTLILISVATSTQRINASAGLMPGFTMTLASVAVQSNNNDSQKSRDTWITGRVVNESGQPIPGAGVYVRKVGGLSGFGRTITAAEDGTFRAEDLAPGPYTVFASVPGYIPETDSPSQEYHRVGEDITVKMVKGGVITGTVTSSSGEPVVGVSVGAIRVRDSEGRPTHGATRSGSTRPTDDRGVYRIYGLQSGSYLVWARGSLQSYNAFAGYTPTFYPSTTRDAATAVDIVAGGEATGIDIRYRAERGHIVSGTLSGSLGSESSNLGVSVLLAYASSGAMEASTYVRFVAGRGFAFYGVPAGEFVLTSSLGFGGPDSSMSSGSTRVSVKGADVTGIDLKLTPAGSLSGRVVLERLPQADRKDECKSKSRQPFLDELILTARKEETPGSEPPGSFSGLNQTSPDEKGEFKIPIITPARYRLELRLPGEDLFVRSITQGTSSRGSQPVDVAGAGVLIGTSQRVSDMLVTIAEGAAGLKGKVVSANQGARLPSHLRVYLVPAETESLDDTVRFAETVVDDDGSFTLNNLAPGRYYSLLRKQSDSEAMERTPRPLAWDPAARSKIRRDAQKANVVIELQRCKVTADYVITYASSPSRRQADPNR